MAFRVADAGAAFERALALGAEPYVGRIGPMELSIPAIRGIGGSLLYFVDRYGAAGSIWDVDFRWTGARDPKPEGVGLGLAVVSKIIEEHDGKISVDSTPGEGSVFVIHLPAGGPR